MSDRPRLLDLYCGAGGASMGYHRAGFDVHGVDIRRQPAYPFSFEQADALDFDLSGFDVVHASPPCRDHSQLARQHGAAGSGWQLQAMIERLRAWRGVWVIENVAGARLPRDVWSVVLCGSAFGLDVRKHRRFASNVMLLVPSCQHALQRRRFALPDRRTATLARGVPVHGHSNHAGDLELWRAAMGIDWMSTRQLAQAIPPAYTEHVGTQLMGALR